MLCGFMAKCYEIRLANEPFFAAIAPLLHSNSGTFIMQKCHFYCLIVALLECKSGAIVKFGCSLLIKTP